MGLATVDWVAFARAAIPYIPEAKRRHAAAKPKRKAVKSAPPDSPYCGYGHVADWYHYIHKNGYPARACRECKRVYRRAQAKKRMAKK